MSVKVGINGCGRIGKLLIRFLSESDNFEVAAVNDPMPSATLFNLLKYDSLHGKFFDVTEFNDDSILLNNRKIALFHETDPKNIPWGEYGVQCVLEASGQFKTRKGLENHIESEAQQVILCQPGDDSINKAIVIGVNEQELTVNDIIISNASCTTNCIAPLIKVLDEAFGLEKAFFNTIHPYTNNQSLHDGPHSDLRRSRAALCNIIPTTSTAVESLKKVLPGLSGKVDGFATRVPIPLGSYVEITACLNKHVTAYSINEEFKRATANEMKRIVEYCSDPVVSTDIIGNRHSAVFDSLSTKVINGDFIQILAWYDNETAYSQRVVDLLTLITQTR